MTVILITDVTDFKNGNSCVAGYTLDNKYLIRPLPYFSIEECRQYSVMPGIMLNGTVGNAPNDITPPHIEDRFFTLEGVNGVLDYPTFFDFIDETKSSSIHNGFGVNLEDGEKYFPVEYADNLLKSIVTIEVNPRSIEINLDDRGKLRMSFFDVTSRRFNRLPLKDLRYKLNFTQGSDLRLAGIVGKLRRSERVLVRLGVGRAFPIGDKNGFWLQVNSIFPFPCPLNEVSQYA